jgi:hypothetical protein
MGWYFVGLIMFGALLMLIVGLIINNIQRQFPVYWWTPLPLRETRKNDLEAGPGVVGGVEGKDKNLEKTENHEKLLQITISARGVTLPAMLALTSEESELIERLQNRLAKGSLGLSQRSVSSGSSANMTMVPSHGAVDQ